MKSEEKKFALQLSKQIGINVKSIREHIRPFMSHETLASISQLSRQTISSVEKGSLPKVAVDTIVRIADALNVPTSAIINEKKFDPEVAQALMLIRSIRESAGKAKKKALRKKA